MSRRHWNGLRMLHPVQFDVNEAWIAFRLNREPIRTEQDGDLNCLALMDAASCFILCTELVPAAAAEPTEIEVRRMLWNAHQHKERFPKTLFICRGEVADHLSEEAARQDIEIVSVPENELEIFTREARDGFAEYVERGS